MQKIKAWIAIVFSVAVVVVCVYVMIRVANYIFGEPEDELLVQAYHEEIPRRPPANAVPHAPDIPVFSLGSIVAYLAPIASGRVHQVTAEVDIGLVDSALLDSTDTRQLDDIRNALTEEVELARTTVSQVFATRTIEEANPLEGRREMQTEMLHALQEAFDTDIIVTVTFSSFRISQVE